MADIERQEDEAAKAFDPRLARRLLTYLRPYRVRATFSVLLVTVTSGNLVASPVLGWVMGVSGSPANKSPIEAITPRPPPPP